MRKTVVIDCFPECLDNYADGYAIVAVDIIRSTTTAVTCVALGRSCFPVPSIDAAVPLAARLTNPLLVGELGGNMPYGFDLNNSPADLELRSDTHRPMILLSTSGTRLICGALTSQPMYVASLRNYTAQVAHLATHHPKVAVIGAGARAEFRDEDQLCCAWIAEGLLKLGYTPENRQSVVTVEKWRGSSVGSIIEGASAEYLRSSGQLRDLEYILSHVDDLQDVYRYANGQITRHVAEEVLPKAEEIEGQRTSRVLLGEAVE